MTAAPNDLQALRPVFTALPKIELHRHLEGAARLSTLVEVARQYKIDVPGYDIEGLRKHVQITPDSPPEAAHFLAKFQVLRKSRNRITALRITPIPRESAASTPVPQRGAGPI